MRDSSMTFPSTVHQPSATGAIRLTLYVTGYMTERKEICNARPT